MASIKIRQNPALTTAFWDDMLLTTKNTLTKVLGKPEELYDSKTQYEWCMDLINDDKSTIPFYVYDWKEPSVIGDDEIINWHIGTHTRKDSKKVYEVLKKLIDG